jgi:cytochrome P450
MGYIQEIQRLYGPVNALVDRQAQQDLMIGDIFIPKGTLVNIRNDFNHYN